MEFSDINFKISMPNMPKKIEEMMEKITRNWHLLKKNQSLLVCPTNFGLANLNNHVS